MVAVLDVRQAFFGAARFSPLDAGQSLRENGTKIAK